MEQGGEFATTEEIEGRIRKREEGEPTFECKMASWRAANNHEQSQTEVGAPFGNPFGTRSRPGVCQWNRASLPPAPNEIFQFA